jgi:hypothetical protein
VLAALVLGILGVLEVRAADTPSVKDVMRRVGAYVDAYGQRASIVVAAERYTQESRGNTEAFHGERTTVSEFAIVKVGGGNTPWQGFRDVLEVDGKRVEEDENRLVRSLIAGGEDWIHARQLSDQSARYNIGSVQRNFNVPTTALFFFRSESHDRFRFAAKDAAKGIWHITWTETYRPTFIRTPAGESIPSEGEMWVNAADGTVRRTVLHTLMENSNGQRGSGRVDVSYQFVDAIGMWLPATMDEEWETSHRLGAWERVRGHAVYSNYRQFTTSGRIK